MEYLDVEEAIARVDREQVGEQCEHLPVALPRRLQVSLEPLQACACVVGIGEIQRILERRDHRVQRAVLVIGRALQPGEVGGAGADLRAQLLDEPRLPDTRLADDQLDVASTPGDARPSPQE